MSSDRLVSQKQSLDFKRIQLRFCLHTVKGQNLPRKNVSLLNILMSLKFRFLLHDSHLCRVDLFGNPHGIDSNNFLKLHFDILTKHTNTNPSHNG